ALTGREYAQLANGNLRSEIQVEPLTNYFVGRAMKEGTRAGVGFLTTSTAREQATAALSSDLVDRATVGGVDGYAFLDRRGDWVLWGQMAGSWISGTPSAILKQQESSRRYYQRPDATYVHLDPTLESLSGWSGAAGLRNNNGPFIVHSDAWATSPGFEVNDLGFQNRADVIGFQSGFSWRNPSPDRLSRERNVDVTKTWRWDFGHQPIADSWSVGAALLLRNYWSLYGGGTLNREVFDNFLTRGGPVALAPHSDAFSAGFT